MTFIVTPYSIIGAITTIISLWIGVSIWERRLVRGGMSLALFMFAITTWDFFATLELSAVEIPAKIFWSKMEYLGTMSAPILYLIFALEFTHLERVLTPRRIAMLFIIPVITLILAFTNELHGLIWTDFTPSPAGNNLLIYGHGVMWWIGGVIYLYLAFLITTVILVRAALRFPMASRLQAVTIILAALLPWIGNLIYVSGLSPAPGLEVTPLLSVFTGGALAWAVFRLHLLDPVPLASNTLAETMPDGMIVLDGQSRVVFVNRTAREIVGLNAPLELGQPASKFFAAWPHLVEQFSGVQQAHAEITPSDPEGRFWDFKISPVLDQSGHYTGRMIVLHDITLRKRSEAALTDANDRLRTQLLEIQKLQAILKEQAMRDSLTGLFNRRYLDETLERELARARREDIPVAVVMFDIDHFKNFNDACGHQAGDEKLQALGELLNAKTRSSDIACRYGGEEFVVIMPGANLEEAWKRADDLRVCFLDMNDLASTTQDRITISGGVAVFPAHGVTSEALLGAVDQAMYAAKAAGRNCVEVFKGQDG